MTPEEARRLRRTVHKSERNYDRKPNEPRRYAPPIQVLYLFVLSGNLTADTYAMGRMRVWSDPNYIEDVSWETVGDAVRIYPWKLGDDKQINSGREVWCFNYCGRWTAIIPEECLDDREV